MGIVFLFHYQLPSFWNLDINAIAQTEALPLETLSLSEPQRPLAFPFSVFRQWISYGAGPITPALFPLFIFVLGQIAGWALLMSTATLIRSRWFFLFCALTAVYIFLSDSGTMIWPGDNYALPDLLLLVAVLGLAYAYQSQWLKGKFLYRLIIFSLLFAIPYLAVYARSGWQGWQHMVSGNFFLLLILSLGYFLFVGKDLVNLLILVFNNRRRQEKRVDYRWIVLSWMMLLVSLYFLVHEFFRISIVFLPPSPLRPSHFLFIASLITVFSSQNIFRQVQHIFTENVAFTFFLLSWGILTLSFLSLHYAQGDQLFVWSIDRILSIIFLGFSLGQVIYVHMNFAPLLRKKIHAYYLMGRGPRFGLIVVFFIGIFMFLLGEGAQKAKSLRLFFHSQLLTQADEAMFNQDIPTALGLFQYASEVIPASIKAHYNRAAILMENPEDNLQEAIRILSICYSGS